MVDCDGRSSMQFHQQCWDFDLSFCLRIVRTLHQVILPQVQLRMVSLSLKTNFIPAVSVACFVCVNHPRLPRRALLVVLPLDKCQVGCILLSKPSIVIEMIHHMSDVCSFSLKRPPYSRQDEVWAFTGEFLNLFEEFYWLLQPVFLLSTTMMNFVSYSSIAPRRYNTGYLCAKKINPPDSFLPLPHANINNFETGYLSRQTELCANILIIKNKWHR